MTQVAVLTINQKDSLVGQRYDAVSYFNPVQDCYNEWVISEQEIEGNIYPEFDWLDDLTLINWCAPTPPPITGGTGEFLGS